MFECRLCSSLAKIFPDERPNGPELTSLSALGGETVAFQIAYTNELRIPAPIRVELQGEIRSMVTLRRGGWGPVENMGECLRENAENLGFVRRKPGLFPDVLYPDVEW